MYDDIVTKHCFVGDHTRRGTFTQIREAIETHMKADEREQKSKLDAYFKIKSPAIATPDDCTSTSNQDKNYVRLHAPAHPESMPLTPTKKNSQPLAAGAGHLARFGTTKPAAAPADASNEQRYVGMGGGQQRPETPPHMRVVRAEFPEAPLSGISSKTTNQQSGYTDPSQFTNAADCVQQPCQIDSSPKCYFGNTFGLH